MTKAHRSPALKTGAAYFGNRFLGHAEKDLDALAACCDYVVHTVSETDFFYHKAAVAKLFEATRKRGLEIWADPWGLGGVFGGEALSKYLLEHPDDWQVLSDGRKVPAACLNRPGFRNFVKEWTHVVRRAGAEVIFWDEPHVYFRWDLEYDGVYSCVCPICQALYRKKFGGPMPKRMGGDAAAFRRDTLSGFLDEMMVHAREERLKSALCLYAYEGNPAYDLFWKDLSALPRLDIFGCDPYWRWPPRQRPVENHVRHYSEKVLKTTVPRGQGSQIWIQAMRLPKNKEDEIVSACRAAAGAGVTHLAAWSYDGGALLDTVLAENPSKVWSTTADIFKKLRGAPVLTKPVGKLGEGSK